MARSTLWALLTIAGLFPLARAQNCLPGYEWASNRRGESVCELMRRAPSALPWLSFPQGDAAFDPPGTSDQNIGVCSGAYWLLVSSCADCLGRQYHSWSTWSSNCRTKYTHLPPNPGLQNFELPAWIDKHHDTFINDDEYNRVIAGGPDVFPVPPQNPPPAPPPPSSASSATRFPFTRPVETTAESTEATSPGPTASSSGDATSTRQDTGEGSTTRPPFDPEMSATSVPSETDSDNPHLTSINIFTTVTTTDANGQQTVVTSSMPTLVDPSGSGFGDSPGPGTISPQSKKANVGAIVGGVVAGLVVLVLIVVVLLVLRKRRRKARIAPSTAFIQEYNREFERYEDEVARMASPRPFNPAGARSVTPSDSLPLAVESKSQDQLLEKLHGHEQDHFRSDSVRGHAATTSLLDGQQPRT